jgi:hypothetical protein
MNILLFIGGSILMVVGVIPLLYIKNPVITSNTFPDITNLDDLKQYTQLMFNMTLVYSILYILSGCLSLILSLFTKCFCIKNDDNHHGIVSIIILMIGIFSHIIGIITLISMIQLYNYIHEFVIILDNFVELASSFLIVFTTSCISVILILQIITFKLMIASFSDFMLLNCKCHFPHSPYHNTINELNARLDEQERNRDRMHHEHNEFIEKCYGDHHEEDIQQNHTEDSNDEKINEEKRIEEDV